MVGIAGAGLLIAPLCRAGDMALWLRPRSCAEQQSAESDCRKLKGAEEPSGPHVRHS